MLKSIVFINILLLTMNIFSYAGENQDTTASHDLVLTIKAMTDPPYQTSWWPWAKDHFIIEASICNNGDSTWRIDGFWPCYDCNPKIFLEHLATGKEVRRTSETDIVYIRTGDYYILQSGDCYVDTLDIAEWIQYDLEKNESYRFWIEYKPWASKEGGDSTNNIPISTDSLISDTIVFIHR